MGFKSDGDAHHAAGQEGQQPLQVEASPHRQRRQHLPREPAEHRHGCGQPRLDGPGPDRQGHHAEGKTGQALHEAGHGRTQHHRRHHHRIHRVPREPPQRQPRAATVPSP
jgi:hypothetical protein